MKNVPSKKHSNLLQNADSVVIKLQADINYTVFFLDDGQKALMAYSLKNYQQYLSYPFVRVNKSCIINLMYLKSIDQKNKKIELKDGSEVQISRRRMEEVLKNISVCL